jgi:hypothetical protein
MVSLSTGNAKLAKTTGDGEYKVLSFGLPADMDFTNSDGETVNTCPGAASCRAVCYAKQGRYAMESVARPRRNNLEESMKDSFVDSVLSALARKPSYNVVRVHDSGDYYSQEYFDKWVAIASARPDVIFYSYTKNHRLDMSNRPSNLRIVRSLGGRWDRLVNLEESHSRIFASHAAREAAGYANGNVNDVPAIEGMTRIGLVYHGTRKLTQAQAAYFV